jgi:hypothetical protein
VQEIKNDLGLKADDKAGMMARLKAQGVNASAISTFDGAGDDNASMKPKSTGVPKGLGQLLRTSNDNNSRANIRAVYQSSVTFGDDSGSSGRSDKSGLGTMAYKKKPKVCSITSLPLRLILLSLLMLRFSKLAPVSVALAQESLLITRSLD